MWVTTPQPILPFGCSGDQANITKGGSGAITHGICLHHTTSCDKRRPLLLLSLAFDCSTPFLPPPIQTCFTLDYDHMPRGMFRTLPVGGFQLRAIQGLSQKHCYHRSVVIFLFLIFFCTDLPESVSGNKGQRPLTKPGCPPTFF